MAKDQPEPKTETLEMNPSEATQFGETTDLGATIDKIGSDDYVVLTNIFDGIEQAEVAGETVTLPRYELIMKYGNVKHRWAPGQTVNLPGYKGRHFLKHITKMLYLRVDDDPTMDRNDYPLSDRWVSRVLVKIQKMMNPDVDQDLDVVQELPDYIAGDETLSSALGKGEQVLGTAKDAADFATDESEMRLENDPSKNITPSTIDAEKAKEKTAAKSGGNKEAGRL